MINCNFNYRLVLCHQKGRQQSDEQFPHLYIVDSSGDVKSVTQKYMCVGGGGARVL